ncbi:MAG TPA: deoxyribose-phosphate aldolase [Thermodesulfovibrionales bacterium]|nr:deoxyribose-phosphate aldolase [Thermodesulfovibrionales bacterium]
MDKSSVAQLIDHTLLKPDATLAEIRKVCEEAVRFGFHSVCVNPFFLPETTAILSGSGVKVTTVIGFPLGMTLTNVKVYEAMESVLRGSEELDIVMNIGMAKSGKWRDVQKDISDVISATKGVVHKVIIEACYLTREEKGEASRMVLEAGAEFVKTSTGFGPGGATVEDIYLIRSVVKDRCAIKASGGVGSLRQVREFFAAGATRIGTSSGVAIMKEMQD